MDVREKLVELLRNAKSAMKSENLSCDIALNVQQQPAEEGDHA